MSIAGIWEAVEGHQVCTLSIFVSEKVHVFSRPGQVVYIQGAVFDDLTGTITPECLENAYGIYSYVLVESGAHRNVVIGTDKLGFSALYYSFENTKLLFSDDIGWIKSRLWAPSIDYDAIEEMLNLGEILGTKTNIKQIQRLGYGEKIMTVSYTHLTLPTIYSV